MSQLECLRIIIQSNSSDPVFLEGRAEAFIESYRAEVIEVMTEEFLSVNIAAVVENLLEPPKNIDKVYFYYYVSIIILLTIEQREYFSAVGINANVE